MRNILHLTMSLCRNTHLLFQFFTWNQQSGGCGLRTWIPGNYVKAFGQRFGTKTIILDEENTVPVGSAFPFSFQPDSAWACRYVCSTNPQCKSWTWSNSQAAFNKNICALNYGVPTEALSVGPNSGITSGAKICQ